MLNKPRTLVLDYYSNACKHRIKTNLKQLQKRKKTGPDWVNLYGAPLQSSTFGSSEWRKKYNEHPESTDDPPESSWLNMTSTDFKTGDRIPMGKVGSTQEKDATYLG